MVETSKQANASKSKVIYHAANLSAFMISNLVRAIGTDNFAVSKHPKPVTDRPEIFNVELRKGPAITHGEVTIADTILNAVNTEMPSKEKYHVQGSELKYDNWLHILNNKLRPASNLFAIEKAADGKETIKAIAKDVEEQILSTLPEERAKILLAAMVFSYLEPATKLLNKRIQTGLAALKAKHGFTSFDEFVKGGSDPKREGKNVSISSSQAKLVRINQEVKLPKEGQRNILITSALPYVNNVPHLGNIIGCVLSGDVYARFCRQMGHNAIYVCGTDEYGTATETKAMQEGKTCQQICDHYNAIHTQIYEWFDCDFDKFGRTTTPKQTDVAQDIFKALHKAGKTFEKIVDQQYCSKCQRFLADRFVKGECHLCHYPDAKGDQCDGCGKLINAIELIKPQCSSCNQTPEVRQSKHIFIDLPEIAPDLEQWVREASEKGKWSSNSTSQTLAFIKGGLQGRCITRDLKWGTPVPLEGFEDKVFYVWFDAPIGYISITANYTDQWKQWWQNKENVELYQFMGKDNITFHTVIFPSTLIGTEEPWTKLHHISTTEFLNYEIDPATGKPKKFSKSRNTGVFGDDAMETGVPSEVWRYYLLVNRPENQDTTFMWSDFQSKNNNELLANLGNFSNRCLKFIVSSFASKVPKGTLQEPETKLWQEFKAIVHKYVEVMEAVKIKEGLKIAMEFSSACNVYFQEQQPWALAKTNKERCSDVMYTAIQALFLLSVLMEPFMPSFSAKVNEQLGVKREAKHEHILGDIFKSEAAHFEFIPAGHVIGTPEPIFREIKTEEVEGWKAKFGGNDVAN